VPIAAQCGNAHPAGPQGDPAIEGQVGQDIDFDPHGDTPVTIPGAESSRLKSPLPHSHFNSGWSPMRATRFSTTTPQDWHLYS